MIKKGKKKVLVLVVCVNNNNNNNERFITLRNDIADQQLKTVSSDIDEKEKMRLGTEIKQSKLTA